MSNYKKLSVYNWRLGLSSNKCLIYSYFITSKFYFKNLFFLNSDNARLHWLALNASDSHNRQIGHYWSLPSINWSELQDKTVLLKYYELFADLCNLIVTKDQCSTDNIWHCLAISSGEVDILAKPQSFPCHITPSFWNGREPNKFDLGLSYINLSCPKWSKCVNILYSLINVGI